ncbi:MAG: prepilin-type N-terminal cleavage/methylation domain-containing protein [Elusimicrobiales bacterium]|nr:prepilin-type N-terminal cleavage/methylation domain-containing protein [Elusimicrobiales bacterium]
MGTENRGFTLIELLVVVLIIGILASAAVPQYFKVVERSRVTEAKSMFASVKASQSRVMAKTGAYTGDWSILDITFRDTEGNPCAGTGECEQRFFAYSLDTNGSIYAVRKSTPPPPSVYGSYVIIFDITTGGALCTQANCVLDLI